MKTWDRYRCSVLEDAQTFKGKHGKWVELSKSDLNNNKVLAQELFDLVDLAYKPIGGHVNITSPSDIVNNASFWVAADIDSDPEADVVKLAKKKPYGLKSVGMGHDGAKASKDFVIAKSGVSLKTKGFYAEMSGAIAHVLLKYHGAPSVNNHADVEKVLGKTVEWIGAHPDGKYPKHPGWYRRKIAGKSHMKILLGSPFGVKSESVNQDESTMRSWNQYLNECNDHGHASMQTSRMMEGDHDYDAGRFAKLFKKLGPDGPKNLKKFLEGATPSEVRALMSIINRTNNPAGYP